MTRVRAVEEKLAALLQKLVFGAGGLGSLRSGAEVHVAPTLRPPWEVGEISREIMCPARQ